MAGFTVMSLGSKRRLLWALAWCALAPCAGAGETGNLGPDRITQAAITEGGLAIDQIRAGGLRIFTTPFNKLDGYGDGPMNAADTISHLDPKPGLKYSADQDHYVIPDLIVEKIDGEYMVFTNDNHLPRLRLSKSYQDIARDKKRFDAEHISIPFQFNLLRGALSQVQLAWHTIRYFGKGVYIPYLLLLRLGRN